MIGAVDRERSAAVDAVRSGAQFGEQGWRCLLPELGLVLETLPSESDLPAQPILTDATRAKMILEQGMRAGSFALADMVSMQTDRAAPESGGGDPTSKDWDWNSPYWRKLGAPWGGTHASAPDLARFLAEFLDKRGAVVKPQTAQLMVTNHNPAGLTPRGLGFSVGTGAGSRGCSDATFGHTGSTGTIAWADPSTHTICVVLTSLPARAVDPHPRDLAASSAAAAAR